MELSHLLSDIDAVIFDLDGVLLNTEDTYTEATREILAERADEFTWELKSTLMGRAPRDAAQILIDELKLIWTVPELLGLIQAAFEKALRGVKPIAGAEAMLDYSLSLSKAVAIATSSSRELFHLKEKACPFINQVGTVICADDHGLSASKPAPDIFLKALASLGVSPERALIIEDSPAGLLAARRAKVRRVLGILHPQMPKERLAACDFLIRNFWELPFLNRSAP